ncbi:MAG: gamma-glutamyltransferase [Gemmatimonadetes bacterium]|nr:MAG: gamma-glutamyltransferase [Gemmatimonadota bacterium]
MAPKLDTDPGSDQRGGLRHAVIINNPPIIPTFLKKWVWLIRQSEPTASITSTAPNSGAIIASRPRNGSMPQMSHSRAAPHDGRCDVNVTSAARGANERMVGSPTQSFPVDPNSGQRAQFDMHRLLGLGLLVLAACRSGIKLPETIPVTPGVLAPIPPAEAPPEAPARPAAEGGTARPALIATDWPLGQRVRAVAAEHAMVVTSHPLASDVGVDILRRGGNAVDAAVAVAFALTVVHPVAGNIGGGGFMVIRTHDDTVRALDFRETAPSGATRSMYVDSAGNVLGSSLTGHRSVGVPGTVAGLFEAHRRFGRLPWKELVAPAVGLARDGHVLDGVRSRQIAREAERLARFPASRAQFLVNGEAPPAGTRFVQPDLARTLQLIADSGPQVFYQGGIAELIVQEMAHGGGLITREDLARYRVKWRDPIAIGYRGYTIYTMPPPSGGGVTLAEILNVMEGYAPLPPFGSARLMHLQTEAMRRAYADRNAFLGDPDFVEMPLARLLSKAYAATLRANIDLQRATPSVQPRGARSEGTETTHYSVVDVDGNAVSCTTTLNNDFGSAVTVTGAGFLLNDEMDDFMTAPGKPNLFGLVQGEGNAIAPGKRMLSGMTPAIVLDSAARLFLVLGSPGGSRITTAVYQVLSNVIDQDMPLPTAIAAPRLHHQAVPDTLHLERDGFVRASIDSLEAMGHNVRIWNYKTEVNAIARAAAGWVGVADPRRGGGAAGY